MCAHAWPGLVRPAIVLVGLSGLVLLLVGLSARSDTPQVALLWSEREYLRVHVPDLTGNARQQDSYIIEYRGDRGSDAGICSWFETSVGADSDGQRVVMIDAGNYEDMRDVGVTYLKSHGIAQIDELYVTHAHKDHYGGVRALLESDIPIKRLFMNIPLESTCNREIPWGCDYPHVLETIELAKSKGVEHSEIYVDDLSAPEKLFQADGVDLTLLFAPRGEHPDLGVVDINDQSMIMRLATPDLDYLLIGDLNRRGGAYLVQHLGDSLKSDVLQAPHHGAEGAAPDEFLQAVDPNHAIVSSFTNLWCSKRSERIRTFFERNDTVARVLGMQGNVMVRHFVDAEPVWVEDRSRHMDCDTYWAQQFAQPAPGIVLSSAKGEIRATIDLAEVVKVADFTAIKLSGWALPTLAQLQEIVRGHHADATSSSNTSHTSDFDIGIGLLHDETQSLQVFSVKRVQRPDVIEAHKAMIDEVHGVDAQALNPGFEALIRGDDLNPGSYTIWIVVTANGQVMSFQTDQSLRIDRQGNNGEAQYELK